MREATVALSDISVRGGDAPTDRYTAMNDIAPTAATAAPVRNAACQPNADAIAGNVAAAIAPPSGSPAWRIPMANPRCCWENQVDTDLLPPGCAVL